MGEKSRLPSGEQWCFDLCSEYLYVVTFQTLVMTLVYLDLIARAVVLSFDYVSLGQAKIIIFSET